VVAMEVVEMPVAASVVAVGAVAAAAERWSGETDCTVVRDSSQATI